MRRGAVIPWALAATLGAVPAARAGKVELFGEVRASGIALLGSGGQFGTGDPSSAGSDPCGPNPRADGGAYVNGTGLLLATASDYRYQLALSAGYYGVGCTDSLRRPLGGLDFRGRHRLSERTQLRSGVRTNVDVFDRTLDIRLGTAPQEGPVSPSQSAAGTVYLTGSGYLELERWLRRGYALRSSVGVQTLQVFTDIQRLAVFTTLGPMTAAEVQIEALKEGERDRLELPVRYRVSHFYPVTLATVMPAGQVPPAHDGSVRFAWERRLSQLLTVRTEGGLALARQDHLCLSAGTAGFGAGSCSIDPAAPGIRGAARPPIAEVALSRRTTGTFVGEVSLRYQSQKHVLEASLSRGYEPNAYASALDLVNRLSATAQLRPLPELLVSGSLLIGHHGHTSPQRVTDNRLPEDMSTLPYTAPQNRTMVLSQGSLGVDWALRPPVALFAQTDLQVFAIRGEQVPSTPPMMGLQVSGFPSASLDNPAMPPLFQTVWRVAFMVGVRVFTGTPEREPNLLQNGRTVP